MYVYVCYICKCSKYSVYIFRDADMEDEDNSGKTPLLTAAANGKTEAVIKLLGSGADVKAVDGNGRNVVHFIVNESHVNMLKVRKCICIMYICMQPTLLIEYFSIIHKREM